MGLAKIEGAFLDGQPARHLAHGREQWQAPVGALDGLVRDGDDVGLFERAGQLGRGGQVQIREEDLAGAQPRVLRR